MLLISMFQHAFFFISLNDKHQNNALRTQNYISLECWFQC